MIAIGRSFNYHHERLRFDNWISRAQGYGEKQIKLYLSLPADKHFAINDHLKMVQIWHETSKVCARDRKNPKLNNAHRD